MTGDAVSFRSFQDKNSIVHFFGESTDLNLEWRYIVQMRFRVASDVDNLEQVVDGDLFEFGRHCPPIRLQLTDPRIRRICIELRFVEKVDSKIFLKS